MKNEIGINKYVSVVICTFNRAKYLEKCLESLKKQTYRDFEIIVVNGPSTDETGKIMERYPEIKLLKQEKLNGLSFARNLGINASAGEIIAFIDDDAVADINWIRYLVEGYVNESIGGIGGPVFDITGKWYQFKNGYISKAGRSYFIIENDLNYNDPRGNFFNYIMGTNSSFRKNILQNVGLFDEKIKYYIDETDVCVRVIKSGYKIKHVDNAIVFHEMAEGHNRKSPVEINWSEIMKNVIYFSMKNFNDEFYSYTLRPAKSMFLWLKDATFLYLNKQASLKQLFNIYFQLIVGFMKGYKDGLFVDKNESNKSAGLYAIDGTQPADKLNKYCEVDSPGFQTTLPIFIKQKKDEQKIKIAFMSQEFSKNCKGGNCRHTYDLAHGFAELGNEVHVVSKSEKNSDYEYMDGNVYVHKIVPESINFLNLPSEMNVSIKNLSYSYAVCLKLLYLIDKYNIQIVEAPLWDAEGFVFSLIKPVPLVIRLVTPLAKVVEIQQWQITKDIIFANWMEGETTRRADMNIAISKDIGTMISNHHNLSKEKIELCPLGTEIPDEHLIKVDQKKSGLNVLFVGRIETRKGVDTLFKALPVVLDKVPETQFYLVGSDTNLAPGGGSYKKYLLKNLDKKFHKNVTFVGFVDDFELKNYYKNCDLLVAPSLYESFGLIFLEAMAWGRPVIGCNIGGIPEIVEDGKEGILISPNNNDELASAIIKLLSDEDMRIKFGTCGRQKVENEFSISKMAELSNNIYEKILYKLKTNDKDINCFRKFQLDTDKIDENFPKKIAQMAPDFYKKLLEKQAGISFNDAWNRYYWVLKLLDYFDKYVDYKNKTILDVGCGTGNVALALIRKGAKNVVGVDIKFDVFGYNYLDEIAELQNISQDKIKLIEGDICDEHFFNPETFDIIAAVDSFEHINDPEKALRNCKYFLKKGGYIIIDIGPLYYSPIGHHLWKYFPKETDPWAHLRYEDITKVKDIDNWGFRHFSNLNKVTIDNLRNYIKSLNLEIIHESIGKCGEDMFDKYASEINFEKVPNKEDLFIENVRYILKKR